MVRLLPGTSAIDNGMARIILDSLCDRLVPVWVTDGSKKMLMHPDNDVAALVLSGDEAPGYLRDEVEAWRSQYDM